MAKGNAASGMGSMMGGIGKGMGSAAGTMGMGGGEGAYAKGQSPMAQQKSMYSQMQPQMQMNKGMMNPGTQMQQDDPYSQNNPFIGMSRSHAMNTGQKAGYDNFQNMMQPGFWDQMKQQMAQQRGMSGMLPPQGQNIQPPGQGYGPPMRAQAPGLQDQSQGNPMQAQMPMQGGGYSAPGFQQEQQAQLPAYGAGIQAPGGYGGIRGPGGGGYGGGSIMNYLNPQRAGQVRF